MKKAIKLAFAEEKRTPTHHVCAKKESMGDVAVRIGEKLNRML